MQKGGGGGGGRERSIENVSIIVMGGNPSYIFMCLPSGFFS